MVNKIYEDDAIEIYTLPMKYYNTYLVIEKESGFEAYLTPEQILEAYPDIEC